jgi:hypothetical protein
VLRNIPDSQIIGDIILKVGIVGAPKMIFFLTIEDCTIKVKRGVLVMEVALKIRCV